jgi:OOP family OmpA-OmpF porin
MMNRKSLACAVVLAACMTGVFAAPSPSLEKGQVQLDLGAWNTKAETTRVDAVSGATGKITSDSKWNFSGGLTYGLTDRWSLEYAYHGLKSKQADDGSDHVSVASTGDENEVNLIYGINKNFGVYAGWNRIKNALEGESAVATNNVAQIGLIAKAPLGSNASVYARGALGTKSSHVWEAGVGIGLGKNADLNIGWRQVKTKIDASAYYDSSDWSAKYKGLILGLSYRFGGGEAPVAAPVVEQPAVVTPTPVVAPPELKDYYLDSIHFDFDVDTPKASESGRLAHFVNVAKANPNDTFKLVGDTDAKGGDSYNDDLSKRRVLNVAKYATNNGVPAAQLKLGYRGKTDPAETNATEEGRAANRRVDIWWTK